MAVTEQEQADFEDAVEHNVEVVERLIKILEAGPFTERNDVIATLSGFLGQAYVPAMNTEAVAVTAIAMLMTERRARE